jgi:hypothetical protein
VPDSPFEDSTQERDWDAAGGTVDEEPEVLEDAKPLPAPPPAPPVVRRLR